MRDRTIENVYDECTSAGCFIPLAQIEANKIKTMRDLAISDLAVVKELTPKFTKESGGWNIVYKLHYDVIHSLIEAFVRCDKMKAQTHECLFVYVCQKHPELEFNWDFFERIRTKRNGSVYYGQAATYNDWKAVELQMNLYIDLLRKKIEEKLQSLQ